MRKGKRGEGAGRLRGRGGRGIKREREKKRN